MIRMLKGFQDVVLFQSTYLQVRLLQTILFATCTKYRIIFCGWVVGCPSFFYFFSLKNISSIRCNCTQYKYNNMKSVHNSSEKKAAFHQIAISISCKKSQGEHKKSRLLPVPLLAPGVLPLKNGNTIKCHGKVVLTFIQYQQY